MAADLLELSSLASSLGLDEDGDSSTAAGDTPRLDLPSTDELLRSPTAAAPAQRLAVPDTHSRLNLGAQSTGQGAPGPCNSTAAGHNERALERAVHTLQTKLVAITAERDQFLSQSGALRETLESKVAAMESAAKAAEARHSDALRASRQSADAQSSAVSVLVPAFHVD